MIKVYNSLSGKKEIFTPVEEKTVKIYTCGVTTYDSCHIGHGRSLYVFDVIGRYLRYRGYKVIFVRNITDIDDKIINKASQLGLEWREVSNKYIESYHRDLKRLNLSPVDFEPKATENIPEMIACTAQLIDKGYAYVTDTGVYFEVKKFKGYGKLSGQKINQMKQAVRISRDENKKDALDFALWKSSKNDEPGWDSPWGRGRPGWHIECSVMSQKYLGQKTIDIHGGGRDLIFPHHENESAQSECLSGKKLANYWLHHGLLTIDGKKMAKSLGNFITLGDIFKQYSADILKVFYLQAHYSSPIDFSREKMLQAKKAYEHIVILKDKLSQLKSRGESSGIDLQPGRARDLEEEFQAAMDDDFNTPKALAALFNLINQANKVIDSVDCRQENLFLFQEVLNRMCRVFGFDFQQSGPPEISQAEIKNLIEQRNRYRSQKRFFDADKIRDSLLEKGVILEDKKDKTVWRKNI